MSLLSKEKIASEANLLLGGEPISDLDADTREAEVMAGLIDFIFESLLTEAAWNFAIKDEQLSIEATAPSDRRYKYQGQLPLNFRKIIAIYDNGGNMITDYSILADGTKINTNTNVVWIKYTYIPTVYNFPGYFRQAFVYALAAAASEALTGIATLNQNLVQQANGALKRAKIQDGFANGSYSYMYPTPAVIERH